MLWGCHEPKLRFHLFISTTGDDLSDLAGCHLLLPLAPLRQGPAAAPCGEFCGNFCLQAVAVAS
eukprot:4862703-Amphidinium_carterae.1